MFPNSVPGHHASIGCGSVRVSELSAAFVVHVSVLSTASAKNSWVSCCSSIFPADGGRGCLKGGKKESNMEKLMSLLPLELRQAISDSAPEELEYTCQALLDFLHPLPQFQRVRSSTLHFQKEVPENSCGSFS